MDYFAPGLREISRRLVRQGLRLRVMIANRELAKAEATLGLLGWQQADFDENTQTLVERIVEYEREQARATNQSAELGLALRTESDARDVGRRHFEREQAEIEAERQKMGAEDATAARQLAENRNLEQIYEKRMPELDRELRECSRRHEELRSVAGHSAAIKQELRALRERAVAIPNEAADLRMRHLRSVSATRALESQLERHRARRAELDRQEHALHEAFRRADADLATKIHELERQRAVLDGEFESLERSKANPYREVGRVLADSGIAPLNQPQALERVRRSRFLLQEREHAVLASLEATAAENPVEIRQSLLIWLGLGLGAVAFFIALIVLG